MSTLVKEQKKWPKLIAFLDWMCEHFPVTMGELLDKEFGSLGSWFEDSTDHQPQRGCLVGSTALVLSELLACATPDDWKHDGAYLVAEFLIKCGYFEAPEKIDSCGVIEYDVYSGSEELAHFNDLAHEAGMEAAQFQSYLYWNLSPMQAKHIAEREIKAYIRKRLKHQGLNEQEFVLLFTHAK